MTDDRQQSGNDPIAPIHRSRGAHKQYGPDIGRKAADNTWAFVLKAVDIVNEQPQLFPASFLDEIRKDAQLLEQEQQEHTGLASARAQSYPSIMIIIRFPDAETERRALGYLAGRFSFKSWATGETMVPERALSFLAAEGIRFSVEGPATYERLAPLRDLSSAKI